jgi:hypothetical protein
MNGEWRGPPAGCEAAAAGRAGVAGGVEAGAAALPKLKASPVAAAEGAAAAGALPVAMLRPAGAAVAGVEAARLAKAVPKPAPKPAQACLES